MHRSGKILAAVLGVLLAACLAAAWLTGDNSPRHAPEQNSIVDRRLLDTTRQVAGLAETTPEIELARQAERLADHELDQAYVTAVREAAEAKPVTNPEVQKLTTRVVVATAHVAAWKMRIAALERNPQGDDSSARLLELAKAQLALDEDELEDARLDLSREGGDDRARLQQAARDHAAAQQNATQAVRPAAIRTDTLGDQARAWLTLTSRRTQVQAAMQKAADRKVSVEQEHKILEEILSQKAGSQAGGDSGDGASGLLARLRNLSDRRKTLTELDRRIQDCGEIVATYGKWITVLEARRRDVLHVMLWSFVWVLGILLAMVVAESGVRHAFRDEKDRRRVVQQRFLAALAVRAAAGVAILLIIFGTPSQTPTIIGLATAGLTVALKDFLVAFLGWFVLIGRNGVRVGDWVEIKGVGGEVIEVGLFKTVLLEMGNWTNTGHPTGRRVSFMNGYAIESAYFNFSTAGQWLWDELQVTVPKGGDPYATAQRIRELVERETESDAQLAEHDWERITRQYGTQSFSAKPAVDLRPASGGLEVQVRYITRGPQRYEVKSRLFRQIVDVLHAGQQT
jgi:small-conductance mechanosensitive channel